MTKIVKTDPIDVTDYLAAIGLSVEELRDIILIGEAARDACTPNDPPSAPGFDAWARSVRAAGEILAPSGWTRTDEEKLPLVLSPNAQRAFTIVTGDEGTGILGVTLKTKYAKGPATVAVVEKNQIAFPFLGQETIGRKPTTETWMLVRRRTPKRVYAEFSLPSVIGDDGRIEDWEVRLILEPIDLESTPSPIKASEAGDTITVPVKRRAKS